MFDLESAVTNTMVAAVVIERIATKIYVLVTARRKASGKGLTRAFSQAGNVLENLDNLDHQLNKTEGYHSLRLLVAHNSGSDLSETMLWKSTVMTSWPRGVRHEWNEQPLDLEYINRVLQPVVDERRKLLHQAELNIDGLLGPAYKRLGVGQSVHLLVDKSNSEIAYVSIAFDEGHMIDEEQWEALRVCEARIQSKYLC